MNKENKVGQINLIEVTKAKETDKESPNETLEKECKEYNENVKNTDLSKLSEIELQKKYIDGTELLNSYYITCEEFACNANIIMNIHYSINLIMYQINRNTNEYFIKNLTNIKGTNEKLARTISSAKNEIRKTRNQMESILTTVISIILTISVITAAIAGIEKIDANYILPFVATVFLFGTIIISFVYSLYKNKLTITSILLLLFSMIFTISIWFLSWKIDIGKPFEKTIEGQASQINIYNKND